MNRTAAIVGIVLVLGAVPSLADDLLRLEAEDVFQYGTYGNAGGQAITMKPCNGASNGYGVDGVDWAGDFIAWNQYTPTSVEVTFEMKSARTRGVIADYAIHFFDETFEMISADTVVTVPGSGVG
jgi:hypothetical protein